MSQYTYDDFDNFILAVHENFRKNEPLVNLATEYQSYHAFSKIFMTRQQGRTGRKYTLDAMTSSLAGTMQALPLYATRNAPMDDNFTRGEVTPRFFNKAYTYDKREMSLSSHPEEIINIVKQRKIAADLAMVEFFQDKMWEEVDSDPTSEAFLSESILSIPYWVVSSTNNTPGFNGTVPSGHTTVGGINPTTHPNWANYTGEWTNIERGDFDVLVNSGCDQTRWAPVGPVQGTVDSNYIHLCDHTTLEELRVMLNNSNQNLGASVGGMDSPTFRGAPVMWEPALDGSRIMYSLNLNYFHVYHPPGWMGRPGKVEQNMHTVIPFEDYILCLACTNRRAQAVYTLAA